MMSLGKNIYEVEDPSAAYPIFKVSVFADTESEAIERATEAMMGCIMSEVAQDVMDDFIASLKVKQTGPGVVALLRG